MAWSPTGNKPLPKPMLMKTSDTTWWHNLQWVNENIIDSFLNLQLKFDGLVHYWGISSALALEIPQSCTKPTKWFLQNDSKFDRASVSLWRKYWCKFPYFLCDYYQIIYGTTQSRVAHHEEIFLGRIFFKINKQYWMTSILKYMHDDRLLMQPK